MTFCSDMQPKLLFPALVTYNRQINCIYVRYSFWCFTICMHCKVATTCIWWTFYSGRPHVSPGAQACFFLEACCYEVDKPGQWHRCRVTVSGSHAKTPPMTLICDGYNGKNVGEGIIPIGEFVTVQSTSRKQCPLISRQGSLELWYRSRALFRSTTSPSIYPSV